MRSLRAIAILFVFLLVTLILLPWQKSALWFGLKRRKSFPQNYHRFMAKLFGLRVRVIGEPVQGGGVLIVANHTSYFDIVVFSISQRVSFVAKSQVRDWPFFSTLASLQETIYVERERRSKTGEARDEIRDRLRAGDTLVLFPEGTSNDGNRVLPFKSALMGAAETTLGNDASGTPIPVTVQPVSVAYVGLYGIPMGRENRPMFAWYGDMELIPHLWEALKMGPIDVVIEYHPPMTAHGVGGRKALAAAAEDIVRKGQARALAGVFAPPKPADKDEIVIVEEAA